MNIRRIFDMAYHRDKFIDRVGDGLRPAMTHICLIIYCNQNAITTDNINHWLNEVKTPVQSLIVDNLKGSNSPKSRKKAIIEGYERADLLDSRSMYLSSKLKFKEEGFNVKQDVFDSLQPKIKQLMEELITVISNQDIDGADEWFKKVKSTK